jgi:TonB family protein
MPRRKRPRRADSHLPASRSFNQNKKTNSPPSEGGDSSVMKNVNKSALLVSLLALGAATPGAFGLTTSQAYIESYHGRTDIPVPVKVVAPSADSSLVGTKVEVEFLVDARGLPQNVQVISSTDRAFGASVREAVAKWKFEPAMHNGAPVPMKVQLPVLVNESD